MKNRVIGILAHVDAGKTTLSEALLFAAGRIRKMGRVDFRTTYLDTHELERERGITIFSKQAVIETPEGRITLLDTPGHVDFSAEAERTLSVLDYAILVISGSAGVQAHTETLWELLERYRVPTFIFVTKMDLPDCENNRRKLSDELSGRLSAGCVDFSAGGDPEQRDELTAMTDEDALEEYSESGEISEETIARLIRQRKLFPCFFGSGIRLDGVEELLGALAKYAGEKTYPDEFSARVFKIGHDRSGARLTYLKLTGGSLAVRQSIRCLYPGSEEAEEEKITGIRLYSGAKYDSLDSASAGDVVAVTGLSRSYIGQGLGADTAFSKPYLEPVMNYRLRLPADTDARQMMAKLRELEAEEPLLHLVWNERYGEIHAQMMGQVQCEVVTSLIKERYGVDVTLEDGRILYRETVTGTAEGVGHFEPLRHYAEVHLLIRPLPPGTGLLFDSAADSDYLDKSWQKLILSYLEEKQHLGVLTGAPLTDAEITLLCGRAHLKHTHGADMREATLRAVRQGLMVLASAGKCRLLEPYYQFTLEVPGECVGRAMSDIVARQGTFTEKESAPGVSVLTGKAPVSTVNDYAGEVAAYTRGRGRFSCRLAGYYPCHDSERVIAEADYSPQSDLENTPDSVFCAHGAGFPVPWNEAPQYMHLELLKPDREEAESGETDPEKLSAPKLVAKNLNIDDKELEKIMEREFGPIRRREYGLPSVSFSDPDPGRDRKKAGSGREQLYIIDGYNVIFAWEELAETAKEDLEDARRRLCELLVNYQAFTKREMILVFDAYNVKTAEDRRVEMGGLHVVYTKENQIADAYIEKLISDIGKDYSVRVVTSDGLIQLRAVGTGVLRMSAREFHEEVAAAGDEIAAILKKLREQKNPKGTKTVKITGAAENDNGGSE